MADLQTIEQLLQASLDHRQQKEAETSLRNLERQPQFSIYVLQITASDQYPPTSRLAAALYFKNFVKRNWVDVDGNHLLPENEVTAIKQELVALMVQVPPTIQAQLGDAISEIASSDFWRRWETLTDDLVSRFSATDPKVNNGVLRVAHSIFKRWRPLFQSNELNLEIKQEGGKFCIPFLQVLESTNNSIQANASNKEALSEYMATLHLAIKTLHDLTYHDLLEELEPHISGVCTLLNNYLQYDNALLHTDDDSEAGFLELVKGEIFELLSLWVSKYEEDITSFIDVFANTTWAFLVSAGSETKYDIVVSRALILLTRLCGYPKHANTFNNDDTLRQVVERVVIPSIAMRESDVETFEDEPMEFVRKDLEGTDAETRRRAATDFLRQLQNKFSDRVTRVVMAYVEKYLQGGSGEDAWKAKDTAIYLYCSIAAVGTVTAAHGVVSVNPHTNILEFFSSHVASDLANESSHPILHTDAIRYLYIFRTQVSVEQWQEVLQLLVRDLGSSNAVIRTYAAIAVERALTLTTSDGAPYITKELISPQAKQILQHLFSLVERDSAPEKIQENEFLMRCIMRVIMVVRGDVVPYIDFVLTNFINIIKVIRHNPSNPLFYYYLFEAVGAVIRYASPTIPDQVEQTLYGPFAEILINNNEEFVPYALQILAALLESNISKGLADGFASLIPGVLMPVSWESKSNTPALARLLSAMIARGPVHFVENDHIQPSLGIFQKLIASKKHDIYGFDILEALLVSVPYASIQQYMVTIFNILLTRLAGGKTAAFQYRFVRLYHLMSALSAIGADSVIAAFEEVQQGVYAQLYTGVILPSSQELVRHQDRKNAVISFTKTISNSERFATQYAKGWAHTTEALLRLMLNPPVAARETDNIVEQDTEDSSFGVGFTRLSTCTPPQKDLFAEITDLKSWIGESLKEADASHGGRISKFVQERLSPETRQTMLSYLQ